MGEWKESIQNGYPKKIKKGTLEGIQSVIETKLVIAHWKIQISFGKSPILSPPIWFQIETLGVEQEFL